MKIVHVSGGEYPDVLGSYDRYEEYDDESREEVFFYGYKTSRDEGLREKYKHYKRRVYLNIEAPCSFFTTKDAVSSQSYFNEVYTICPYTAKWLNGRGETEYIPILQPFKEALFMGYSVSLKKKYDVIYHGGIYSPTHTQVIDVMKNYRYVFSSLNRNNGVTHRKISSRRKWDLIAASKCSVAINLLYPSAQHIRNLKTYDDWASNEAFKDDPLRVIPQSKARIIEAAACGSLNLVMRDKWNLMELWFDKDEFVYWETVDELGDIIDDVANNYDKYIPIIERAYQKAQMYTVDNFIKMVNENKK